jgi:type I restriction enzyme S subunit
MSWKSAKLGEVCTIEKGNIGIMKAIPGEYPLVVLGEERRTHNEFQFDDEAVIIPLVSSTGHGHRSMKRIFFQTGKFSVGSILCAVIPKDKTQLSAEFLYRYLDFNKEKELVSRMKGMANVSLPMKEIASVEIPLPPLEVQQEFINQFQNLESGRDQISAELAHQLALVKELRQAYLREAMQGNLVPQDSTDEPAEVLLEKIKAEKEKLVAEKRIKRDKPLPPIEPEEVPFEIPSNWSWCRLGEISNSMSTGMFGTMLHQYDYVKSGIPLVNPMNMVNGKIIPSEKMMVNDETKQRLNSYCLVKDDVVIARRGDMGRCAIVTEKEDGWLCGTGSFFIRLSSFINRDYFVKVFSSDYSKAYLSSFSVGSTMDNLNHRILNSYPFPLPPLTEQERIVAKLERLMKFCDELEANIRQGITNADRLLQTALKEALEPK